MMNWSHTLLILLSGLDAFAAAAPIDAPNVRFPKQFTKRSTFSTGTGDSGPQGIDYINFRVQSAGGAIEYLAPLGANVPLSVNITGVEYQETVNVSSQRPYSLATIISAPQDCSSDLASILAGYNSTDDVWTEAFQSTIFLDTNGCGIDWAYRALGRSVNETGYNVTALNPSVWNATNWNATVNTTIGPIAPPTRQFTSITVLDPSTSYTPGPYLAVSSEPSLLYPVYRLYSDPQYAFNEGILPVSIPSSNWSLAQFVQAPSGGQDSFVMSGISVPVPSRLYYGSPTAEQPLLGLRIGVKDIYDIAGVRTGCGNRAYYALYDAANANSYPVQRLLSLGAVIVGKTKTSQFANGESPTADWVDQLSPFNPRGDGYQTPSSSSAGSGASLAAYDWLDYTIGSDTGGSIRNPAGFNGLLGMRPSWGALSLEGVMPLSDVLDTAGYFARDARSFQTFGAAWYGIQLAGNASQLPSTVLAPIDFWTTLLQSDGSVKTSGPLVEAATLYAKFIDDLAAFLAPPITGSNGTIPTNISRFNISVGETWWNATNNSDVGNGTAYSTTLNISSLWNTTNGDVLNLTMLNSSDLNATALKGVPLNVSTLVNTRNATSWNVTNATIANTSSKNVDYSAFSSKWAALSGVNESLASYANLTYPILIGDYQRRNLGDSFLRTYRERNDGNDPFLDPVVLSRWSWAAAQPNGSYQEQLQRKQVFEDFLDSQVLTAGADACSSSILVYPQTPGVAEYRSTYIPSVSPAPYGFSASRLSVFGSAPEIVIPIGEVTYNSTIARTTNFKLPVTISIVGKRGCDAQLLELAAQIEAAGLTQPVKTGSSLF